jgi:small nuclear ribonucleoprotein (snRNP)-like protein
MQCNAIVPSIRGEALVFLFFSPPLSSFQVADGKTSLPANVVPVRGVLKGFDTLVNLVLDDCVEFLRDPEDPYKIGSGTRKLGLVVCRGSAVMCLYPTDGAAEIPNPFAQPE